MKKKLLTIAVIAAMLMTLVSCGGGSSDGDPGSSAEAYPEKDIVIYVNSKAGSSGDSVARQVSLALEGSENMNGHQVIVNNIIDGNGTESWTPVKDGDPDGYSMAMMSTVIVSAELLGNSPLTLDDFDWLCGFLVDPQWITVPADAPYNTFGEMMDYIKEHPGEVNWGTANATASDSIFLAKFVADHPEYEFNRITYDGGGEMLTALLGGYVDVCVTEYLDIAPNVEAGTLKTIGVMSAERIKGHEDVPTLAEEGYGIINERARGMAIPKGMDEEVKAKMVELMKEAFESDTFQEWMVQNGVDIRWMSGEEFKKSYEDHRALLAEGLEKLGN